MSKNAVWFWLSLLFGAILVLILYLGLSTSLSSEIDSNKAVCTRNGQDSIVLTDPAFFARGGTGPKVMCVKK